MKSIVLSISRLMGRFFSSPERKLTRSQLVGLYLVETNVREGAAGDLLSTRQRRNGRHSQTRTRQ